MSKLNAHQVAKELEIRMLGRSHMQIGAPELRALLTERRELLARQAPSTPAAEPRGVFELLLPEETWGTADAAERAGQDGTSAPSTAPTLADQYSKPDRAPGEDGYRG